MKKFLALILTGVMVTSISVMALAENAEPETTVEEAGIEAQAEDDGEQTEATTPDDSTDSENPANPDDSTDPENPTVPDGSTDPENPTVPDGSTDPEKPTTPDGSTDPENPTDPDGSTDPENPTDPDGSTDPEKPTDPDGSTDPENPTDPDGSIDSEEPANPMDPDDSNTGSGDEDDSGSGSTVTDNPNATCTCWYPDNCPSYAEYGYCCGAPDCPCGGNLASSNSDGGEQYDRGSEAEALAIEATGVSTTTFIGAATENKSIGEYMNNAVAAAPGLDNAVPVSQGGNVIINGMPSNQTFYVLKVLSGHTDSAKTHAASLGGKVLNVARIDARVSFNTATVNFYMPGVKAGQNIQVYQYDYASGQWTSVAVAEIREDHVVVDMTSLGVLAFIEVPAAQ